MISFEVVMKFQEKTKLELILSKIDVNPLVHALSKGTEVRGPKCYRGASLLYALFAM
jgi:hypothetical protein